MMKIISDMILCVFFIIISFASFLRADPVSGGSGDLNSIGTDRALNTGIIERFCFLMLSCKPAAHAVNTDAPMRLRGFSGR
ncbi:hypothetical protein DKG79_23580 (plasmid) [Escherichia fergusonii]|nr:hypothetical protein DKG79_23580 [Escherichia fergusonii]